MHRSVLTGCNYVRGISSRFGVSETQSPPFHDLGSHGRSFTRSLQSTAKSLSPVTFVDGQTKEFLKNKLQENQLLLWRSCLEASIYCALLHEVKRFFRDRTTRYRHETV